MATGATRKAKAQKTSRRGAAMSRLRRVWGIFLGVSGVSLVLSLVGFAGWKLVSLPVNRVAITGDLAHVSREALTARISTAVSGGFIWLDLDEVREPIEALPWVHRVVVRRQWPDSIEVRVIEQRAIAHWGDEAYLNHSGEVFTPPQADDIAGLPRLSGPEGRHVAVVEQYRLVQERLQALGLRVTELDMDRRGGLRARLENGGELVLGREDLDARLDRLETIYRTQLQGRAFARVDLRYSHGAAIAWQETQQDSQT